MDKVIYFALFILLSGVISLANTQDYEGPEYNSEGDKSPHYSCEKSTTTVNGIPMPCAGHLIFHDDFGGNSLDPQKWTAERRIPRAPDYEFNYYIDDVEEILKVENGVVRIKPKSTAAHLGQCEMERAPLNLGENCTADIDSDECVIKPTVLKLVPPYISAQFTSKYKFAFKYGRVEVRAKMPQAMWVYPQLWLQPNYPRYGNTKLYYSGQMRIGQTRDDGPKKDLITGLVINTKPDWYYLLLCINGTTQNLSDEFHTYEMLWTPDVITFSLDNTEYCRFEVNSEEESFRNRKVGWSKMPNRNYLQRGTKWAPFDEEFYLLFGEGVGGYSNFPDDGWSVEKPWQRTQTHSMMIFRDNMKSNTTWLDRADLEIDYVKVYSV
ncbi:gram-negative bacteria-binding protein 3-like [Musca vetustissima]|uniref:gram-negative bacteria-binding protein 3-like n=1 Tax=Musca vetustissima TaxID=27455 RepID=UPI002AB5F57E|nr:gram-negative bacteria-binding protein 3-like [Musca vetustissima]